MTRDVRPSRFGRTIAGLGATLMALAIGLPPFTASTPVSAANPPLDDVIDVEAGGDFACAIVNEDPTATTGSVWCWGNNFDQQLGNGSSDQNSTVAIEVSAVENGFSNSSVSLLALGVNHACAVESGELYCWGSNEYGKAGKVGGSYGNFDRAESPTLIDKPSGVTSWDSLALGEDFTCALTTNNGTTGVLYCWGHGNFLGNGKFYDLSLCTHDNCRRDSPPIGNFLNNPSPVEVPGVSTQDTPNIRSGNYYMFYTVSNSGYTQLGAGDNHACALKPTGSEAGLYCWGKNASGQTNWNMDFGGVWKPAKFVGSPNYSNSVFSATDATALAVGAAGACIEKSDGVFCFGEPNDAEGDPNHQAAIDGSGDPVIGFKSLGITGSSIGGEPLGCGIRAGEIWCFGDGSSSTISPAPQVIAAGEMPTTAGVTDLSIGGKSGQSLSCAVNNRLAYCWGSQNFDGRLGNDSTDPSATPVRVLRTPPPPTAPTDLIATAGDGRISISFTPGATNGWPVTTHQYSLDGGTTWSYLQRPLLTSPIEISLDHSDLPLRNGQEYTVILRLADGNAFTPSTITGDSSDAVTATPSAATAPGAPAGVTATAGDAAATVSWTAPAIDGGSPITGYIARVVGDASLSCTAAADTTSCEIAGLTNGTPYTFEVIAKNLIGDSGASSPSTEVTPAAAGGASEGSSGGTTGGTSTDSGSSDGTSTGTGSTDGGSSTSTGPIAAPATATTSEAVTADDAAALANEPGDGKVVIDGTAVTPTVGRVTAEGADTPAAERTPEQVAAVQAAARTLVESFNTLAGDDSPIAVTNTDTGAVITGLLTNPDDPDTPVEVPAERVLVMTAGDVAIMMVATGTDGTPLALDDGALQVTGDGNVAVALAGLPASTGGEIVLLPSRTVIGTFTTSADGTLIGEVVIPADLAAGDYGIAIAVGSTRTSIGVKALPSTAVLPATGGGNAPATMALALLTLGMMLVVSGRRRTSAH